MKTHSPHSLSANSAFHWGILSSVSLLHYRSNYYWFHMQHLFKGTYTGFHRHKTARETCDLEVSWWQHVKGWKLVFGNIYKLMKVSGRPTIWETHSWTYCEKHKVLLVVLPNTVIDPGAVVVHFPYAAFANTVREPASLVWRTREWIQVKILLYQPSKATTAAMVHKDNMSRKWRVQHSGKSNFYFTN